MADKCFGCTNKYKFREKPTECPKCRRIFCNKCLDRKKVKEEGATCVYCSQKQKSVNKAEEADILQNFQERYYKHKHQGPPIVTRLQYDPKLTNITQAHKGSSDPSVIAPVGTLAPEDQELEERFRKLREDRNPEAPSLNDLQNQLDKLQGNEKKTDETQSTMGGAPASNMTQFEQTQDLIQQMKEEVELDKKLDTHHNEEDTELANRFDALQGRSITNPGGQHTNLDHDNAFLSNTGKTETDIDPERLLHDLKDMLSEQEREALKDLQAPDIQALLKQIKPPVQGSDPNDDEQPDITYPTLPMDEVPSKPRGDVSEEELKLLLLQAIIENKHDEEARLKDEEFMSYATKKVSDLIKSDSDSDSEVKSKPKGATTSSQHPGLNFSWDHFGTSAHSTEGATCGPSVASTLGALGRSYDEWGFDDEEFDQQVDELISQMSAEAKLEDQLESQGLGHLINNSENKDFQSNTSSQKDTNKASNLQPYSAIGHEEPLPWCCMCNVDATVRCYDCDGDLYCVPCFSQAHEGFGLYDHRYVPYEPPKTFYT